MSEPQYAELRLDLIEISSTNPRKRIDDATLAELSASIARAGVLQPILVRQHPHNPIKYEIVAGERRYRASKLAGMDYIPATIRELTDLEAMELQVLENLHRDDLHPLEEADGFQQLLDTNGWTVDQLTKRLDLSRSFIYASLKLCSLAPAGREAFYAGKLTASTALLVARIPGAALQAEAVQEITKPNYNGETPSVRDAARTIRWKYMTDLDNALFDQLDTTLPGGDCTSCPKRSGNCTEDYPDIESADVCTDTSCFQAKKAAHIERLKQDPDTITGEHASRIFPTSSTLARDCGYENPWQWYGDKQWRQWLGDDLPTRTVIKDDWDEPITVVDVAAAKKLIEERGLLVKDDPESVPDHILARQEKIRDEAVAREAAEESEIARRVSLLSQLHQKLIQEPSAKVYVMETVMPLLIKKLWIELDEFEAENLHKARGEPLIPDEQEWDVLVNRLSSSERRILLCELAAATLDKNVLSTDWNWSPDNQDDLDNFYAIFRSADIEPELSQRDSPTSAAHAEPEISGAEELDAEVGQ